MFTPEQPALPDAIPSKAEAIHNLLARPKVDLLLQLHPLAFDLPSELVVEIACSNYTFLDHNELFFAQPNQVYTKLREQGLDISRISRAPMNTVEEELSRIHGLQSSLYILTVHKIMHNLPIPHEMNKELWEYTVGEGSKNNFNEISFVLRDIRDWAKRKASKEDFPMQLNELLQRRAAITYGRTTELLDFYKAHPELLQESGSDGFEKQRLEFLTSVFALFDPSQQG